MAENNLNLPKTAFSMKANLPSRTEDIIHWDKMKLYKKLREEINLGEKKSLYFMMGHHMQMVIFIWVLL